MAKKTLEITVQDFKRLVEVCTREAVQEARDLLKEGPEGALRKEMADWIVRQWFSPKYEGKPWYRPGVTSQNVFDVIFDPDSRFPYEKNQLLDMFEVMQSEKGKLGAGGLDKPKVAKVGPPPKVDRVKGGDESLKGIAAQLGVSHQAVDQIWDRASEKFRKMTTGKRPDEMHPVDADAFNTDVDTARRDIAKRFADVLSTSGGSVSTFLLGLRNAKLLDQRQVKEMSDVELRSWMELAGKPPEVVEEMLLADIEDDNNLFKAFQTAVAKTYAVSHDL